jgi:hypothetical protein
MVGLGYAYALNGNIDMAHECLNKLAQRGKIEPEVILHMDYTVIYTGLNDFEKAFFHIEEGLKQKAGIFFIKTASIFSELRKDPRFKKLMNDYGYAT